MATTKSKPASVQLPIEAWPVTLQRAVPGWQEAAEKLAVLRERREAFQEQATALEKSIASIPPPADRVAELAAARLDGRTLPTPAPKGRRALSFMGSWFGMAQQKKEIEAEAAAEIPAPATGDEMAGELAELKQELAILAAMIGEQQRRVDKIRADAPRLLSQAMAPEIRLARAQIANGMSLFLGDVIRQWELIRDLAAVGVEVKPAAAALGDPADKDSPIALAVRNLRDAGYKI